jgi:drug/metabolite transporter (DMT)-like permease
MTHPPGNALRGIGLMVLATVFFAILDTTAKYTAATVPVVMALAVRYLVQALLSTAFLVPVHGRALLQVAHPRLQMLRGALLTLTTLLALLALKTMPVGEFAAIIMLAPMLVTVLAGRFLKEKVSGLQWLFVLGGLVGTLLIVRPGGPAGLGWAALIALACVLSSTVFQLLSSHLGRLENPSTTHFWSVWFGALLGALVLPWTWTQVDSAWLWAMMVLMGGAGAAGHFVLAQAYRHAPASALMPYMYCSIGFAVLAGWLVFGHVPDVFAWAGIALIAVCGITSAWWTAHKSRVAAMPPET